MDTALGLDAIAMLQNILQSDEIVCLRYYSYVFVRSNIGRRGDELVSFHLTIYVSLLDQALFRR
jgi:hypothetical protein